MTKRKPWETPENGANEPLARKLADLGPLMRETADADNEPPDPAFLERLKDALPPLPQCCKVVGSRPEMRGPGPMRNTTFTWLWSISTRFTTVRMIPRWASQSR